MEPGEVIAGTHVVSEGEEWVLPPVPVVEDRALADMVLAAGLLLADHAGDAPDA